MWDAISGNLPLGKDHKAICLPARLCTTMSGFRPALIMAFACRAAIWTAMSCDTYGPKNVRGASTLQAPSEKRTYMGYGAKSGLCRIAGVRPVLVYPTST